MRAVVQRTLRSSVTVDNTVIGAAGQGLTVLLGIGSDDSLADVEYMAEKITNLRIFHDDQGKMNCSLLDVGGEMLVISQFTLYGDCRKGRRPSFDRAARPEQAVPLYKQFIKLCAAKGIKVCEGQFQSEMIVSLDNHGPVTMLVDSKREF